MTTPAAVKPTAPPTTDDIAPALAPAAFPDFPPRADMMNTENIHDHGIQAALRLYLGYPETTVVLGEVPLYWRIQTGRAGVRIPDLLIAFRIRRALISRQKGYAIAEQGKPPDFVLEVASDTTAANDQTHKWRDYANFGVTEYWLFDPDWGQRYPAGLIGWRLVNGRYQRITIRRYGPGRYYGWSEALGLYICWEHGRLRWYAPETGYLRTHDEERSARIAEHDARIATQIDLDTERTARITTEIDLNTERTARLAAESSLDTEREARLAAESNLDTEREARLVERAARLAAETQRNAAQSEVERLRNEIARLRTATDQP